MSQHPPASRVHGVEPDVFDLEPAVEAAAAAAAAAVHDAALVPMKFEIIDGSELKKLGVQLQKGAAVDVRHVGDVEGGVVAAKGVRLAESTGWRCSGKSVAVFGVGCREDVATHAGDASRPSQLCSMLTRPSPSSRPRHHCMCRTNGGRNSKTTAASLVAS